MRTTISSLLGLGVLTLSTMSSALSYQTHIGALATGNMTTHKGKSTGEAWFNVTAANADKLPNIQGDVGIMSMDNFAALEAIADLAQVAMTNGMWGDVVYLFNAFTMNAYSRHLVVSSDQMRHGLLQAVMGDDEVHPNINLIDLYASTSTSIQLANAFNALKTVTVEVKRGNPTCDGKHAANKGECEHLADEVQFMASIRRGGGRNKCNGSCCISWSVNATFRMSELYDGAHRCLEACGEYSVSCRILGVDLGGTLVNQCLSNRANGCG